MSNKVINNTPTKSTTRQSVIAVVVLLVICFVCVGILAVLNDLLYVSDNERFLRAMTKIYPQGSGFVPVELTSDTSSADYGQVLSVSSSEDGAYIIESRGINGYSGGTVTCYVVVKPTEDGKQATIVAWSVKDYTLQTYMSKIPSPTVSKWYYGADIANVIALSDDVKVAGASESSRAINNAINMSALYARTSLGLGSNPEAEALEQLQAELVNTTVATAVWASTPVAGLSYLSDETNVLSYAFESTVGDKDYFALVYDIANVRYFYVTTNTIIDSERLSPYKSEGFPTEVEQLVTASYVDSKGAIYNYIAEGESTVYTVKANKIKDYVPNEYVLTVKITAGAVKSIAIEEDGFVPGKPTKELTHTATGILEEATIDNVDSKLAGASGIVGGATESADTAGVAVKLALTHYDSNKGA